MGDSKGKRLANLLSIPTKQAIRSVGSLAPLMAKPASRARMPWPVEAALLSGELFNSLEQGGLATEA
ncbi:UNVERIFIED_CONTAM: hypothetical protein Sradi_0905900 [Sesamum radiatum]|uniref:Uncharacterized protein n=1 Tax=Sesamum radiatum TaxID=300843 RepID=A0AAW2V2Z0_SESRA